MDFRHMFRNLEDLDTEIKRLIENRKNGRLIIDFGPVGVWDREGKEFGGRAFGTCHFKAGKQIFKKNPFKVQLDNGRRIWFAGPQWEFACRRNRITFPGGKTTIVEINP